MLGAFTCQAEANICSPQKGEALVFVLSRFAHSLVYAGAAVFHKQVFAEHAEERFDWIACHAFSRPE
jgi:hypothetical protein